MASSDEGGSESSNISDISSTISDYILSDDGESDADEREDLNDLGYGLCVVEPYRFEPDVSDHEIDAASADGHDPENAEVDDANAALDGDLLNVANWYVFFAKELQIIILGLIHFNTMLVCLLHVWRFIHHVHMSMYIIYNVIHTKQNRLGLSFMQLLLFCEILGCT